MHDQGAVEVLEEAVTALGEEDCGLRVGLLSGLARALNFQGRHERGVVVRTSAIEMARRLDDRAGLASVLMRSYWSRGATSLEEILEMLTEARDIAVELGNTEIRAEAMSWRVPAFVALGDLESARREFADLLEIAEQTAQPFLIHVAEHYGAAIALCDGRLEESEARARRSHDWSRLLTGRDASGIFGIQMFSVQREQGRLAELAPVVRILAGDAAREGPWRPGLVALLAEVGMETEARRELTRLVADGLEPYRESLWLSSLAYLADASSALGDEDGGGAGVPGARAAGGHERDGRPPRLLLRRGRPLPRDAGGGPGRVGAGGGALRGRDVLEPANGGRHLGGAHGVRVRAAAAVAAGRRSGSGRCAARRGRGAGGSDRDAGAAGSCSLDSVFCSGAGCSPGRPVASRGADPRAGGSGAVEPEGGGGAVDQRAHGREPHAEHPAEDGLREPDRGRFLCAPARAGVSVIAVALGR